MDTTPGSRPARELRARLRADLTAAMKARERTAVSALRTALAAVDNAEAVRAPEGAVTATSEHVAGARQGVGSTEAARRELSAADLADLLRAQVDERREEAARYAALGRDGAAERLRAEADVLAVYLAAPGPGAA